MHRLASSVKKKKPAPQAQQSQQDGGRGSASGVSSDRRPVTPTSSSSAAATGSTATGTGSRRFRPAELHLHHGHHAATGAAGAHDSRPRHDQVVVGIAASIEDGVEDWSADFVDSAGAANAPPDRALKAADVVTSPQLSGIRGFQRAASLYHTPQPSPPVRWHRQHSVDSAGIDSPSSSSKPTRTSSGSTRPRKSSDVTSQHSSIGGQGARGSGGSRHSGTIAGDAVELEPRILFQVKEQISEPPPVSSALPAKPVPVSSSIEDDEDDDPHGFWSSFSTVKDVPVGRPRQPSDVAGMSDDDDVDEDDGVGGDNDNEDDDSDEDWDIEMGFAEAEDEGLDANFASSGSIDHSRRRSENYNIFVRNLHDLMDGETFPEDDEEGSPRAGKPRRSRKASEEPLFQRRRSEYQSSNSLDGSVDGVSGIRASLNSGCGGTVEYTLVDKLRILDVSSSSAYSVRIERYPKPSVTFSNLEKDLGIPILSENRFESWLTNIVASDCATNTGLMEKERARIMANPRQQKNLQFRTLVSLPFGKEFVTSFFKQISYYRFFGEEKSNRELVRAFFEKVSTAGMADENWSATMPPHEFEFVAGCSMEILQEAARMYGPQPPVHPPNHLSLSMLSTSSSPSQAPTSKAAIYWIQQFQAILIICAEAFPQYKNVIALIELRFVCHHLVGFASGDYTYKWQICNHLPQYSPQDPLAGDTAPIVANEVLEYYGALFRHLNTSPESRSSRYGQARRDTSEDKHHFGLSPDVICLQALVLCDIQSLYDSKSALAETVVPSMLELFEFEDDDANIDPRLLELLPPTGSGRKSRSSSSTSQTDGHEHDVAKGLGGWSCSSQLLELVTPPSRTRCSALTFFYERISHSTFPIIKAKCAVVLAGIHASASSFGNLRAAECLAYEALRLIESCSTPSLLISFDSGMASQPNQEPRLSMFNNDGLLSELGREILETLGNVLIKNQKYRYGILCLEAASCLFRFLNQGAEYDRLDRLMCSLTLQADDVTRALPLHEKVASSAQRHGNITEYVYLTQALTNLWIREGNFTRAEDYLASACNYLRDHTNLLPPFFLSILLNGSYSSGDGPSTSSRSGTMMTASSGSSSLSGSFHMASRGSGNSSEMDSWLTHDINLHLLVREVYRSSGRCLEGMRVLEHLLNYSSRLPRGKRTQLRMLLAEDALKMRMFETCRHMCTVLDDEAKNFCERLQENAMGYSGLGSTGGAGSSSGRGIGGMGSEARYCFDMASSLRYIVCRAKLHFRLGEYCDAFAWLSLAHVKSDHENLRKRAKLHALDGKVMQEVCRQHRDRFEDPSSSRNSVAPSDDASAARIEEMVRSFAGSFYMLNKLEKERLHQRLLLFGECAEDLVKAEEQTVKSFRQALELYQMLDDGLYQLKSMLDIVQFSIAPIERAFFALGSQQGDDKLKRALYATNSSKANASPPTSTSDFASKDPVSPIGDDTIEKTRKSLVEAQKMLRKALGLAEQVAEPAAFLRTFILCSQVWVWLERIASYKSEKHVKEAAAFWDEAVKLMKAVFLRRVAFHNVSDVGSAYPVGNFFSPVNGTFSVVPILNFSEGFILKLDGMTLQLIVTACQLQQFERVPEYVEEMLLKHMDELLSARMCLSSISHQLSAFRALQRPAKRLSCSIAPSRGGGSSASGSQAASTSGSNSRSASFTAPVPGQTTPNGGGNTGGSGTPTSSNAPIPPGKRAGHKKNQSMSSISELLASNVPPASPFHDNSSNYGSSTRYGGGNPLTTGATPRTGLASLSEKPNVPHGVAHGPTATRYHGFERSFLRTRGRSRSAPQPFPVGLSRSASRSDVLQQTPTVNEEATRDGAGPQADESQLKRTPSVKFIDLADIHTLPSEHGEFGMYEDSRGFVHDEGSSSNGAIGLCDFDESQSEKLWWIFNLWRDAKAKYVGGKIEISEFRSRNLRYLRILLDAFDPQQIAVLYYGGDAQVASSTTPTGAGGANMSKGTPVANASPSGMLGFDVAHMNSHALIQDKDLVLSIGYELADQSSFGFTKLKFKVFTVHEGDTCAWREEIPRPDWYLTDFDLMEAESASSGYGALRTLRLLGAKLLLKLLGLLLLENTVVIVGSSYPQVKMVTLSLLKLMEPFRWHSTFLPFLPVGSWRFLHDVAQRYALAETAAQPKPRRSISRLGWGGGQASSGATPPSHHPAHSAAGSGHAMAVSSEEPPFVIGATSESWQACMSFVKAHGGDQRAITACVNVVDLDNVDAFATAKGSRRAISLPRKWRKQFLEKFDKTVKQRRKAQLKLSRRQYQVVSSRATTPSATNTPHSMRSPADSIPQTMRSFDDGVSSRSGSGWRTPGTDNGGLTPHHHHHHHHQRASDPSAVDDRLFYDSECLAAFTSGLAEFYDRVVSLSQEKEQKAASKKKSGSSSSSSSDKPSKRQEIKSWFSSSHEFDAFVDAFRETEVYPAFVKERAAMAAARQLQRQASFSAAGLDSSGSHSQRGSSSRFGMMASGGTPGSFLSSIASQPLKSFGSVGSMSNASNTR